MAVRKIRNTWWVDFRFNRQRYRKRSPENSRQGALAYEAMMRNKLARGEQLDPEPKNVAPVRRFGEFAMEWLETYAKVNNKPATVKSKEEILGKHLLPYFGTFALGEIDGFSIEKFKSVQIAREYSNKSINCHLGVLITCLKNAHERGLIERTPRVILLKLPPRQGDYLTPYETGRLLSAKNSVVSEMVLCALKTGMRIGEICGLDWSDIDFVRGSICVRQSLVNGILGSPKNNKARLIPMANELQAVLMLRQRRAGLVFQNDEGEPWAGRTVWRALELLCKETGVRYAGWHILRHTFATQLGHNGTPIREMQALMGHSTIQMTERYTHVGEEALRAAISRL